MLAGIVILVGPSLGVLVLAVWSAERIAPGEKMLAAALATISVLSWAGLAQALFPALTGARRSGLPYYLESGNGRERRAQGARGGDRGSR